MEKVKCLIIGSGPAGYTAAIYTSRANLNPVLYEGIEPGGQLTTTTEIDNYPGYPEGIDGNQLMGHMRKQAERFGADIRRGTVTRADLSSRPFHLVVDGEKQIEADSLIIATGASARYLGLPSETKYRGQGVSACATCDGFFYRKKDVAVVGGGNSGIEAAIDMAGMCPHVDVFEYMDSLKADGVLQSKVASLPNVDIHLSSQVMEIVGDGRGVSGIKVKDRVSGAETVYPVSGVFVQVGLVPNSSLFAGMLPMTKGGEIIVDERCRTSVTGVYAAGDVTNVPYKQIIVAMGEGAKAALSVFEDAMRSVL